eukprot:SAG11_NODE_17_length_26125_cov_45.892723_12_plen_519_part_00
MSSSRLDDTGEQPQSLFRHFDASKDGTLSFAEFRNAVRKGANLPRGTLPDNELKRLYRSIDVDKSGSISIDELTTFIWGERFASGGQLSSEENLPSSVEEDSKHGYGEEEEEDDDEEEEEEEEEEQQQQQQQQQQGEGEEKEMEGMVAGKGGLVVQQPQLLQQEADARGADASAPGAETRAVEAELSEGLRYILVELGLESFGAQLAASAVRTEGAVSRAPIAVLQGMGIKLGKALKLQHAAEAADDAAAATQGVREGQAREPHAAAATLSEPEPAPEQETVQETGRERESGTAPQTGRLELEPGVAAVDTSESLAPQQPEKERSPPEAMQSLAPLGHDTALALAAAAHEEELESARAAVCGEGGDPDFEEARALFRELDADGDGRLNRAELGSLVGRLAAAGATAPAQQQKLGDEELGEAINMMDTDSDGRVRFDEFYEWWREGLGSHALDSSSVCPVTRRCVHAFALVTAVHAAGGRGASAADARGAGGIGAPACRACTAAPLLWLAAQSLQLRGG